MNVSAFSQISYYKLLLITAHIFTMHTMIASELCFTGGFIDISQEQFRAILEESPFQS